jgi:hypothetical protein
MPMGVGKLHFINGGGRRFSRSGGLQAGRSRRHGLDQPRARIREDGLFAGMTNPCFFEDTCTSTRVGEALRGGAPGWQQAT